MLELTSENVVDLYQKGNAAVRKSLRELLGDKLNDEIPVTARVRNFQDALEELGEEHEAVKVYRSIEWYIRDQKDLLAYTKLRIITEALNEGWKPQFTIDERRWYAWYELLTKEEIEAMTDEEKEERRCVGRSNDNAGASGGLVFSYAANASSNSYTNVSARLALKTEALAEYAAKQFIDIYADFCFIPDTAEAK